MFSLTSSAKNLKILIIRVWLAVGRMPYRLQITEDVCAVEPSVVAIVAIVAIARLGLQHMRAGSWTRSAMSQTAKEGVRWILATPARNVALKRRIKKESIAAMSDGRYSNPSAPPEYAICSLWRRKRTATCYKDADSEETDGEGGASEDREEVRASCEDGGEGDSGNHAPTTTLKTFEKVLARGAVHLAGTCRLLLPRAFCERHNVARHVTMRDSTGQKLWHMRFELSGIINCSVYRINYGWREFVYDHSLKEKDRLVFTLLSTSDFLVEFANRDGSPRAMLPTGNGEAYPWSRGSLLNSHGLQEAMQEKVIRQVVVAPIAFEGEGEDEAIPENEAAPKILEDDEQRHEVVQEDVATNTSKEDSQEELGRESLIILPNQQQVQEEVQYCQCDRKDWGRKEQEHVLVTELTYLERKNPDGSSYLQIVDSDSESS